MQFNYDNTYYNEGIGGFHKASIPYIHHYFGKVKSVYSTNHILDFGCGNGFHSAYLRSQSQVLDGVDYSEAINTSPSKVNYRQVFQADLGKATMLPSESYDMLFSIEVIEHVEDYRQFLRNAYKSLKPGGVLFLTTTTFSCFFFILLIIYRRKVTFRALADFVRGWFGSEFHRTRFTLNLWDFTTGHYHGFSKGQLSRGCKEVGFKIKDVRYLPIQDVVPVFYLKQKYNGRLGFIINLFTPVLLFIGKVINFVCSKTLLYTPNILIIAEK